MSLLDLLRGAIAPTAAARVGYLQGKENRRLRDRAEAQQDIALKRQATLDEASLEQHRSQSRENDARARNYDRGANLEDVTWVIDAEGNRVPLPKKVQKDDGSAVPAAPKGALSTVRDAVKGPVDKPAQDTTPAPKKFELGKPSGVTAPKPKVAAPPRIDPNSREGIAADSAKKVNAARARMQYPVPSRARTGSGSASQDRLNAQAALKTAEGKTPHPSKIPEAKAILFETDKKTGKLKGVPNPAYGNRDKDPAYQKAVADSTEYERTTLEPLRQNVYNATLGDRVKIGADAPKKAPAQGPAKTPAKAPTSTPPNGERGDIDLSESKPAPDHKAAKVAYDAAAAQLQAVLKSQLSPELKAKAQAAYDARLKKIAKQYGELNQ